MAAPSGRDLPHLLVSGGPFEGSLLPFGGREGERLLGSGPDCHLRLQLPEVAELHARLVWNERGVFIHDAGSANGTYVNAERLHDAWRLSNGDRIFLGTPGSHDGAKLLVRLPGPPGDYPTPTEAGADGPAAQDDLLRYGTEDEVEEREAAEREAAARPARQATAEDFLTQPTMIGESRRPAAPIGPRPVAARPTVPRALAVALAALVLGAGGYYFFWRSQAPGPVMLSLSPPKAEPGQTILITGTGFDPSPTANAVHFGGRAAQVTSASGSQLSVVVPAGLALEEQHPVRVTTGDRTSSALFFKVYVGPKVSALLPEVALPGEVVRVAGDNLADVTEILVGGLPAEIVEPAPTSLGFRVPPVDATPARWVPVQVQAGDTSARLNNLLIGRLPLVLEVVPARGVPGSRVTLKGRGFDPEPLRNSVRFGGWPALVLSATETEAVAVAPLAGRRSSPPELPIGITVRGSSSTGPAVFTLVRHSAAAFQPVFVAEPEEQTDRVVVATELGPLLRLAGPAAALSTAERGATVAEALNRLVQAASRSRPKLEVRQAPSLGVAVVGTPGLLLSVTAEDAAAYTAGPRPTPAFLARYWQALIEDYLGLFVTRERPYRTLELGARSSALLDIFAQAERRAGEGAGVPVSLVDNLSPAARRDLAELAFALPAEGSGDSGAAVLGRWDGSVEMAGRAPQNVQLRIRSAGRTLQGTLTTRSGAVTGELALDALQYQNGTLRFAVSLGGSRLQFNGRLDGRTLSGTVERADGRGRFTLKWVE